MLVCMDGRIDTNELVGDTRKYYYIVRTAGSVLSEKEAEMLELAVANGVKMVVLATHTDCAAEKVANDPERRKLYPALAEAVDQRAEWEAKCLARPPIAEKIAGGKLLVKRVTIDTATERMVERK